MSEPPCSKNWKFEKLKRNSFRLHITYQGNKNWTQRVLLTSDRHWDNPKSDWDLQIKHLKESLEYQAPIIDAGDFFCLMQGKFDKRSNKSSVRPIHQVDNYIGAILKTGADFFEPYAKQFCVIATGNHEEAIDSRKEDDPMIERFCAILNDRTGSDIHNGGFAGWVIFSFRLGSQKDPGGASQSVILHYDHGYGGGGPVTADMIQHQRRSVYLPDADIILSGHTHDSWVREVARIRLNRDGSQRHDIQTHIKLPSYKDDYGDGFSGWAATKGMPPKPSGAVWLEFYWCRTKKRILYRVIKAD